MAGKSAVQFVVGRVSTVPGFHFSAPVIGPDGYLGVVVLKIDKDTLAQQLYLPTGFVTDSAGVVVVPDVPENMDTVEVELDVLPFAEVVELEGRAQDIESVERRLNLDNAEISTKSYHVPYPA